MRFETAVPIARGGMGEVARAWDPVLGRRVALKFLRFENPELEERMVREARLQARVHHPNVCPVYEVGRHDGRVFIAMPFIEGETLDRAAAGLAVEERVRLVKTVAEAVHAAHQGGLIHRDLKPANILVERTGEGEFKPWVVDFGVARERDVPGATVTGQVVGTPGYISPEQARGEVSTLDRRSDVFSLGVILYELLGGGRPFAGESDVEVMVSLLHGEPLPLRRRAPNAPRDLETVVMKCLETDRERRYDSARALAEELGRFLAGEPVLARPTGAIAQLRARARRRPVTAALLAAAALAVVGLAAALAVSWVRYTIDLRRERDLARVARAEAEARAREAAEVSEFLIGLFESPNPRMSRGADVTARRILDEGAVRIERDLANQPQTMVRMLNVMAESYRGLGLWAESARLAERALAIAREATDERSLEVADSMDALAQAHANERPAEASRLFREVLAIRQQHRGDEDPSVAAAKSSLAWALMSLGELDEAETLVGEALRVLRAEVGENARATLIVKERLASILRRRGDSAGAVRLYAEVLDGRRTSLGADHPDLGAAYNNLALAQRFAGDLAGAEGNYRRSLGLSRRVLGESHPDTLQVMGNLAGVLELSGRSDEALAFLRRRADLRRAARGASDRRLGSDLAMGVGRFLMLKGRYSEAEGAVREAVEVYRVVLGDDHSWTALARGQLAACLFALGGEREARALVGSSLRRLEMLEGLPEHVRVELQRNAEYLRAVGQDAIADRYRSILARLAQPAPAAAAR